MKKVLIFGLILLLTGCFGNNEEADFNDEQREEQNNVSQMTIDDVEEVAGVDPLIERYPGSVRGQCVINAFCIYYAEATVDEVLDFYQELAAVGGMPFNHEILPEEQPHWVNTYVDPADPASDEFAFTLGEADDVCIDCVKWVFYAHSWPE